MSQKIEVKLATPATPATSVHTAKLAQPKRSIRNYLPLSRRKLVLSAGIVILVLLIGFFAYQYNQARQEVRRLSNTQQVQSDEVARIKSAVAALVEIPTDESPTLATVTNAAKLQSQAFFRNAINGDKVLIFTNAKKAILYRPSSNKVIEIAPLNLGTASPNSTGTNSTPTPATPKPVAPTPTTPKAR